MGQISNGPPQYWSPKYLCSALCLQSCVRSGRGFWKHGGKQQKRSVDLICARRNELTNLTISPQLPASILKPVPAIFHHRWLSIIYRRSRCIFLGCNVSTNDENMHWFQQMKINITHISLLKTRPQSQRSAAPWGSRQRNKTITRRKQESDFVGREKRERARKRTHWFWWERRVNVFANQ